MTAAVSGSTTARRRAQRRGVLAALWPIIASLVVFVVVWQLVVFVSGFPPYILPGPLSVGQRFVR
ncbi:MAG: hypothetical protein ACYDAN_02880, partial [Candidatus Limnocylindrales bacterium]